MLISSYFIASDYCWDVEVKKAIERHHAGEACVIPVILRSVDWSGAPFAKLQALPKNAEPVVSRNWHNQDEAFTDVARGIRAAAEKLKKERDERRQKQEADKLRLREQEEENRKLQQQQQERLRLQEQQEEADRLQKQEAEKLRREQQKKEADRLQRQREQEKADKLRPQQQSTANDLPSEKGVDYTRLRDLLKAGTWEQADEETLAVMLKASGRESERWLDSKSIDNFPCTDLRTIDQLWVKYSNGHFGFSVQKRIWESVGKDYEKFGDRVGWRKGMFFNKNWLSYSDLTFTSAASPQGHLPVWILVMGEESIVALRVGFLGGEISGSLFSRRDL
ncbi:GUN4 domain-containing protein [Nostoc sp. NZL]|uniref:GUN4 domain-containing protein n=1 Tax=Nostoc sp. NZL TaxID=2650612 RepID=UPI001E3C90D6|nr:GUN4 domain-containing protein [Nostoc sp. NZL]